MRRLWPLVRGWKPRAPGTLKQGETGRVLMLLAVIATLTAVPAAAARADAAVPLSGSERDFVASLRPVAGGPAHALGVVLFRQPHDIQKVVFLDVWTLGMAPNHSYSLQRATDSIVDDDCQGTNWLTLGHGLEPRAIETNELGFGRAHLSRDLATIPEGTRFDIQFRLIDSATQDVVLVSFCHQYTVTA
jgi:hypothetical protein